MSLSPKAEVDFKGEDFIYVRGKKGKRSDKLNRRKIEQEDSFGTEIDEDTEVASLPPSLKFFMYKELYPEPRHPPVVYEHGWRDIWMDKLSQQFNFNIMDSNLASFLAVHKSLVVNQFNRVDQDEPTSDIIKGIRYSHDRLTYGATSEVNTSPDKDGNMWKNFTIRLCNDGFLYPPRAQLDLRDTNTYFHHNSGDW